MEQSKYLVLVEGDNAYIGCYNRADVLRCDMRNYKTDTLRIFELNRGGMKSYYTEIKIEDLK
jgi:hypothetical protein